MQLLLAPLAEVGVRTLPPDLVWMRLDGTPARPGELGAYADFAVATSAAQGGAGGFVAMAPLVTATIMLLFTDARAPAAMLARFGLADPRGWAGDALGADPPGSLLWCYRRSELSVPIAMEIEGEARRALQPLVGQGAVARIEASTDLDENHDALSLDVGLYRRDGASLVDLRFDPLWRRSDGGL